MDLRQLAALVAVAEEGSFSAAADALHTVQSNVSNHVARLERELGAQLVDRQAAQLTEEGEAVLSRARRIADELDALVADVAALRHEVIGSVSIGVIGSTARWIVPRLLTLLTERHPKVQLLVFDGTSVTLEPRLAAGRLALAVVHLPVLSSDLVGRHLFDEDLVLVVSKDDPLAARGALTFDDLDGRPLLLPPIGTAYRDAVQHAANAAGITLLPRAELDGVRLIASLTFDGYGPAILPATAVPAFLQDQWRRIPVQGIPRRQVGVALRRRGLPSAPVRAVLTLLDEIVATDIGARSGLHPAAGS